MRLRLVLEGLLLAALAGAASCGGRVEPGGSGSAGGGGATGGAPYGAGGGYPGTGGGYPGTGGGYPGTGGGYPGTGGGYNSLGAKCSADADCVSPQSCITATSTALGGDGSAGGYCTVPCSKTSDCTPIAPGARCVAFGTKSFCLEGCDPTSDSSCHNRDDSLCRGPDNGTGPFDACFPQCVTDSGCDGRKCDLSSGLCSGNPKIGLPIGADCDPQAATDPCAGLCNGISTTDPHQGACSAFCSVQALGTPGACGSNPLPGSKQDAACLFAPTFASGGSIGVCGQLCSCNNDCRTAGSVCEGWATIGFSASQVVQLTSAFKQAGLCVSATDADGGVVPGIACP